ncbi:hypothetical protein [Microlunatus sp. GCM10028923]|uniref:BP74-related protein n=1 Tax=Microlunatus sp. GCM10028923 TaxID=3273400 RepID=UPI00360FD630
MEPISPSRWRRPVLVAVAGALMVITGCGPAGPPSPSPSPAVRVATFLVADRETFRVDLATPELVAHAEKLLAGENVEAIPIGRVVRGDPGPNAPWTWHLDPATFSFAHATTEVCDGLPSFVEDETITSDDYCPWSAKITSID